MKRKLHTKRADPQLIYYHWYETIYNVKSKQLILIDLSKAFGSTNRNILWAILYEKGVPWDLIKQIRSGHLGNKLYPKYKGTVGAQVYNDKWVFQGSPISAILFIIYFDRLLGNIKSNYGMTLRLTNPY